MIREFVAAGATVVAYDPVATEQTRFHIGDICTYVDSADDTLDAADALVLATEWPEFRTPDIAQLSTRMRGRLILDGRNVLDASTLRAHGFTYVGIGLPVAAPDA
jgi:UDPglucose 6-dehydrogenase